MSESAEMIAAIRLLAGERFERALIEEFIGTFFRLTPNGDLIKSFLQVSMDEGEELEIGFFTADRIVDITLSNGKRYHCDYPLSGVRELGISDLETKWVLTIKGEKKFDYNVVKPGSVADLQSYENALRPHLKTISAPKAQVSAQREQPAEQVNTTERKQNGESAR